MTRWILTARCTLIATALYVGPALGDANPALAQSLFEEGRQLMSNGKFAEACPKFESSYKLDPAAGTLLNLAVCHEKVGRTAAAPQPAPDNASGQAQVEPQKAPRSKAAAYVAGGAVFGLNAISKKHDRDDACRGKVCATQAGSDLDSDARHAATVSTIGFGVGIVGVGVGAWLLLRSDAKPESKQGVWVAPDVNPTAGGLRVGGSF